MDYRGLLGYYRKCSSLVKTKSIRSYKTHSLITRIGYFTGIHPESLPVHLPKLGDASVNSFFQTTNHIVSFFIGSCSMSVLIGNPCINTEICQCMPSLSVTRSDLLPLFLKISRIIIGTSSLIPINYASSCFRHYQNTPLSCPVHRLQRYSHHS